MRSITILCLIVITNICSAQNGITNFKVIPQGNYITYYGTIEMGPTTSLSVRQGGINIPQHFNITPTVNLTFYRNTNGVGRIEFPIYSIKLVNNINSMTVAISIGNPIVDNTGAPFPYGKETVYCDFTVVMDNPNPGTVSGNSSSNQPLGTIMASILNFDQLCGSLNETQAFNANTSTYAPCDGRSIIGSNLTRLSNKNMSNPQLNNSPDLRGKFLRGLNLMYSPGQQLPFDYLADGDPDGENRTVTSAPQGDQLKAHTHLFPITGGPNVIKVAEGQDGFLVSSAKSPTESSGGQETRPKNIAVYYYIKIN